jgi:hypothetical protein
MGHLNSLTAIGGPDRQLFFELRARVVSPRIFVRSQSLIARLTRNDFSLPAVSRNFYEALLIDDVSRGIFFALVNIVGYSPICALCR